MQEMVIYIGLPASGKTTDAKARVDRNPEQWARISWDDLRYAQPNWKFTREREALIQDQSFFLTREALAAGKSVVIDNTNLSERTVTKWETIAWEYGVRVTKVMFDTPIEECVRRDAQREGKARVGRWVIERMALFNGLISFPPDKKLVLVDMDGTLADCEHRRHYVTSKPKNWMGFYRCCIADPPVPIVHRWVQGIAKDPEFVICIVSGRPMDMCGEQTASWLDLHSVQYAHLFMRNGGDHRQDFLVKQEILDRLPKEQIAFVIDDRDQVVEMWRRNGLRVIQVAEGNF